MAEVFTKSMARNIYLGGLMFFILLFLVLTFDTVSNAIPKRDNHENLTELAIKGKYLWETNDCIGCHTLLGEGAYFAPELGNVFLRFGGEKNPEAAVAAIKGFIKGRPVNGIPGRRSMPQFGFTDEELSALAEFLKYASGINTSNWPPNIQG